MREAEQVRAALERYMARHELKPHPWSEEAGLSERALSHFLKGLSKSMKPSSLQKLAAARGDTIKGMLGFVPSFTDEEADSAGSERSGQIIDMLARLERQVASLTEEIRELKAVTARPSPKQEP